MISYLTPFTGMLPPKPGAPVVTPVVLVGAILLISLMALRELTGQVSGGWHTLARFLTLAIYPLLLTFAITLLVVFVDFVQHPPPLH